MVTGLVSFPAGHLVLLERIDENEAQNHGQNATLYGFDQVVVERSRECGEDLVTGNTAQERARRHGEHHLLVELEARTQLLGQTHAAHDEDGHAGVDVDGSRIMRTHEVEQRLNDDAATKARHGSQRRRYHNDQRIYEVEHDRSSLQRRVGRRGTSLPSHTRAQRISLRLGT